MPIKVWVVAREVPHEGGSKRFFWSPFGTWKASERCAVRFASEEQAASVAIARMSVGEEGEEVEIQALGSVDGARRVRRRTDKGVEYWSPFGTWTKHASMAMLFAMRRQSTAVLMAQLLAGDEGVALVKVRLRQPVERVAVKRVGM